MDKSKKAKIGIIIIIGLVCVLLAICILFCFDESHYKTVHIDTIHTLEENEICTDNNHYVRMTPVNPICSRCGGRDGIIAHECTNPNGPEIFCEYCGKLTIAYWRHKDGK